ncbi:MAG TPA: PD-(D/E)XK nuclease family protein, partial [Thermohalobaculum sp.]|nr:PD-(D/E)XK nuclease family protein [Thermohalobaculum sp.]
HRLLERLPGLPAAARPDLARRLIAHEFPELAPRTAEGAIAEALAVLAAPFAAELFGGQALAEAGLALRLPGPAAALGAARVDRLVVHPDRVLVVDFKTDARPPDDEAGVPEAYLLQLSAYRAGAVALWPGRAVEAAILWTAGPSLMPLDAGRLGRALSAQLDTAQLDYGEPHP